MARKNKKNLPSKPINLQDMPSKLAEREHGIHDKSLYVATKWLERSILLFEHYGIDTKDQETCWMKLALCLVNEYVPNFKIVNKQCKISKLRSIEAYCFYTYINELSKTNNTTIKQAITDFDISVPLKFREDLVREYREIAKKNCLIKDFSNIENNFPTIDISSVKNVILKDMEKNALGYAIQSGEKIKLNSFLAE